MSSKPRTASIAAQVSRRRFLRELGLATGCVATSVSLLGCEVAEVKVSGGSGATELAFNVGDAKYSALAAVGKMVAVNVGVHKLLLIRTNPTTVVAVSRICPHQGCDMAPDAVGSWSTKTEALKCGCHNSQFKADGTYIANTVSDGSSVSDLSSFPVQFDDKAGTGLVDLAGAA